MHLLLNITIENKASKTTENVDWEPCQNKYQEILEKLNDQHPFPKEAAIMEKKSPSHNRKAYKSNHDYQIN